MTKVVFEVIALVFQGIEKPGFIVGEVAFFTANDQQLSQFACIFK